MRKTSNNIVNWPITVNIAQLKAMLGCGTQTANKVAKEAGAVIRLGRRVLYSVPKIERYIDIQTKIQEQED